MRFCDINIFGGNPELDKLSEKLYDLYIVFCVSKDERKVFLASPYGE